MQRSGQREFENKVLVIDSDTIANTATDPCRLLPSAAMRLSTPPEVQEAR